MLLCVAVHTVVVSWFAIYYVAVLAGLDSWGQVISWNLMRSYIPQASQLLDAMGYSMSLVSSVAALAFGTVFAVLWCYYKFATWPEDLVKSIGPRTFFRLFTLCSGLVVAIFSGTFLIPNADYKEPLSLSFLNIHHEKTLGGDTTFSGLGTDTAQNEHDAARRGYVGRASGNKTNLILIVVDALRPDHIGPYGYARDTTPFLSELANKSGTRVVAGIRAVCAETSCGIPSLLSSRYLHDFAPKPFTLQEALSRNGYLTRFILGGDHINFYGLRKIYGEVDHYVDGSMIKNWYMNDDRWVIEQVKMLPLATDQPIALKILLMSAHPLGTKQAGFDKFQPAENYRGATHDRTRVKPAVNFYDNGVLFADFAIQEIVQTLDTKGYLKNALLVITADHGEALGEHGQFSHAKGVYEPLLRIPLIFTAYGYEPEGFRRNQRASSQIDIAPTILRELHIPIPSSWAGLPLQETEDSDFSYFQELDEIGLIDKRNPKHLWKYWINISDSTEYLFDLTRDPDEAHNLIAVPGIGDRVPLNELRLRVRKLRPVGESR